MADGLNRRLTIRSESRYHGRGVRCIAMMPEYKKHTAHPRTGLCARILTALFERHCVFDGPIYPSCTQLAMSGPTDPVRIMFVCLGNICRSPLAEGIFRQKIQSAGLEAHFDLVSSGTGSWHIGEPADRRMRRTAMENGVSLEGHRARQFTAGDLRRYDHIFVMDKANLQDVLYFDRKDQFGGKVRLFREADPQPEDYQVPDPYYGGPNGFDDVFRIVDRTAEALLKHFMEQFSISEKT